jgi:8-oxo-dGTP pyrophosphatase MutT (NUDIX family)
VTEPTPTLGPWRRHTRRLAYENDWITVWHDVVTRPDGGSGIYGVVHSANLAAGVVVLDDADRVLLVGQHRYTLDEYSWEIPEGGVPPGEAPLEGIQRELREETGVTASEWRELARLHLSNSIADEAAIVFAGRLSAEGPPDPEPTEQIEIRWSPFEEVLAMTLDGRITDAMSVVGIQRLALERAATAAAEAARR